MPLTSPKLYLSFLSPPPSSDFLAHGVSLAFFLKGMFSFLPIEASHTTLSPANPVLVYKKESQIKDKRRSPIDMLKFFADYPKLMCLLLMDPIFGGPVSPMTSPQFL